MKVSELLSLGKHWRELPDLFNQNKEKLFVIGTQIDEKNQKVLLFVSSHFALMPYAIKEEDLYDLLNKESLKHYQIECEQFQISNISYKTNLISQMGSSRNVKVEF